MIYLNDDIEGLDLEHAFASVSPQRRDYALRYRFELDRRLSLAVYLLLCEGLKEEYGISELQEFVFGHHGKPALKNHPEIHFNLGATLNKLGRVNDAIEAYQRALELSPHYDEAHNNLGRIYLNKGELELAEIHFKDALQTNPRNYNAHNNYGIIFIRKKMHEEAEKHFQEAVEINPDYTEAYVNLGYLYSGAGRVEQARAAFNNALRVTPDFEPAIEGLQRLESIGSTPPMLLRPKE